MSNEFLPRLESTIMEAKRTRKPRSSNSRDQILKLEEQLQAARQQVINDVLAMQAKIEADIYKMVRLSLAAGVPEGSKTGPMVHYIDLMGNITDYCDRLVLMIGQGQLTADSPDSDFQDPAEFRHDFEDQPE